MTHKKNYGRPPKDFFQTKWTGGRKLAGTDLPSFILKLETDGCVHGLGRTNGVASAIPTALLLAVWIPLLSRSCHFCLLFYLDFALLGYFVLSCITCLSVVCVVKLVSVCLSVHFTVIATRNGEQR